MELWTAFLVGLVGSLHCVGMCGPIALALPQGFRNNTAILGSRLLYNAGRIITYVFLGTLLGLIGFGFSMAGWQRGLSIGLGIALILSALFQTGWIKKGAIGHISLPFDKLLKRGFGHLMQKGSFSSLFGIGLLNGFLPCGLVYLALAGAVSTSSVVSGALYMFFFGLGTVPALFATSILGSIISIRIRSKVRPILITFTLAFGLLFVMRGMNLGIPYISPKLGSTTTHSHHGMPAPEEMQSCH